MDKEKRLDERKDVREKMKLEREKSRKNQGKVKQDKI